MRSADDDHAVLSEQGSVAINWKASGRGPRIADFAYLIWGMGSWNPRRPNQECIDAAVNAYAVGGKNDLPYE